MSYELQAKLLQVLEQHEFVRVGGVNNIKVDVRFICATNQDLEKAIMERRFRDDLFYRLNEITMQLPPLRERIGDVPLLVNHFLEKYNRMYKRDFTEVSPECMQAMNEFTWPGNVRQLENLIKQMVVRQDEAIVFDLIRNAVNMPMVRPDHSGSAQPFAAGNPVIGDDGNGYSLKRRVSRTVQEEEKRLIAQVLNKTNWNRRKAAELLEISYRSLLYKIKEYRINEMK
jgi:transcriptional regulator with PAS, ATPase and Fis domain